LFSTFDCFLPAALLGVVFGSTIKTYLFAQGLVAVAFIVRGIVLLSCESLRPMAASVCRVHGFAWYRIVVGLLILPVVWQ
jgi:undecaprenyl pyrophosphate phosphatase UppP